MDVKTIAGGLVNRVALMIVRLFLFLVVGGVIVPSTVKALPIEFSVPFDLENTGCLGCTGTLYLTFDGTTVSFDWDKLLGTRINTPDSSYLISSSSNYSNRGFTLYGVPANTYGWAEYTQLRVYLGSTYTHLNFYELGVEEMLLGTSDLIVNGGLTDHEIPLSHGVPEPSSSLLLASGFLGMVAWRRRQQLKL